MHRKYSFFKRLINNFLSSNFYFGLRRFYRIYFKFDKLEVYGIVTLIFLYFFVYIFFFALNKYTEYKYKKFKFESDSAFIREADSLAKVIDSLEKVAKEQSIYNKLKQKYDTIKLFKFDPNTITEKQMQQLGLNRKQIKNILNYRKAGGKFYTKSDFLKLYSIHKELYQILKPYINLPDTIFAKNTNKPIAKFKPKKFTRTCTTFAFNPNKITFDSLVLLGFTPAQAKSIIHAREKGWKFRTKSDFHKLYVVSDSMYNRLKNYILLPDTIVYHRKKTKIELNKATINDLEKLGFSKKDAERIIKYRQRLGGYYSTWQLYETGADDDLIKRTYRKMTIDTSLIKKLDIRTAPFDSLRIHPYIGTDVARWIVIYRKRRKFSLQYFYRKCPLYIRKKKLSHYIYCSKSQPNQKKN